MPRIGRWDRRAKFRPYGFSSGGDPAVKLERERDNRSVWSGDDFQKSTSGGDKRVGIVTVPGIKVVLCNFDSIHCVDSTA